MMCAMSSPVFRLVELARGQSNLARGLNVRPQAVQQWVRAGRVPAERIIEAARFVDFSVTPHELDPTLYPHPDDGVPVERRGKAAA